MMSQDDCLASPHHFTFSGVCYEGTNATIQISSSQHLQPATFSVTSVPEPSTAVLLGTALIVGVVTSRIRLRGACAVLAIMSCAAGCATAPSAADQVRFTNSPADVEGCNLLGKVIVGDTDAEKNSRAEVVRLGGNVLLKKGPEVWNGNAYHCPTH